LENEQTGEFMVYGSQNMGGGGIKQRRKWGETTPNTFNGGRKGGHKFMKGPRSISITDGQNGRKQTGLRPI